MRKPLIILISLMCLLILSAGPGMPKLDAQYNSNTSNTYPYFLEAQKVILLGMPIDGVIKALPHEPQDYVKKDEVLLQLDTDQTELNIELIQSQIEQNREVDMKTAQIRFEYAQDNLKIVEENYNKIIGGARVAAEKELKEAHQNYAISKLAIAKAKIEGKQLDIRLRQARKLLEQETLKAPVTGIIVPFSSVKQLESSNLKKLEIGETVKAGSPVMAMMKIDHLRIRQTLDKSRLNSVRLNQTVKIFVEGDNQPISGRIVYISPTVVPEVGKFHIEIEFANPPVPAAQAGGGSVYPFKYRPGLRARVEL